MQSEGCGLYVLININTKPAKINKKSNTGLNDISSQSYFLQTSTDPSTYRANQLTNSISCDCQSEGQIKRYLRFPLTQKKIQNVTKYSVYPEPFSSDLNSYVAAFTQSQTHFGRQLFDDAKERAGTRNMKRKSFKGQEWKV